MCNFSVKVNHKLINKALNCRHSIWAYNRVRSADARHSAMADSFARVRSPLRLRLIWRITLFSQPPTCRSKTFIFEI